MTPVDEASNLAPQSNQSNGLGVYAAGIGLLEWPITRVFTDLYGTPSATMDCKAINYKNIPVQSDILSGIIQLDADSISCFRELDRLVRSDQGIAALVLRVVNSPLYSRGKTIATLPLAISVLGFNIVRSVAMLAFSRSLFAKTKNPVFRQHIWQHSLLTALAGPIICQDLGAGPSKDEAFIAGLMHDTGKVLLFTHDQERYLEMMNLVLESGISCIEAERQYFGVDHCEIGSEAVVQWKLPEYFANYMATDLTSPSAIDADNLVMLSLATANCLLKGTGMGGRLVEDIEERDAALATFGVAQTLRQKLLQPEFVEGLLGNDIYALCANL